MIKHLAWLVVVAGLGACAGAPPSDKRSELVLDVTDSTGRQWTLKDSYTKPMLVDFWATWCAPCLEDLPALQAFHESHGTKVQLLGVALDTQGWQVVKPVQKRHALTYAIAVGPGYLLTDFGGEGPPYKVVVHRGKVLKRLSGKHSLADLEAKLAEFIE